MPKKISILGDSVSTYSGYTPRFVTFYDSYVQRESGVTSVEDTWWMQVVKEMDGEVLVNNSISGSMVSGRLSMSAASKERIASLGEKGVPDVILVQAGANDWGFGVLPEEFEQSYCEMLYNLKHSYPHTEIWCATLMEGAQIPDDEEAFSNVDSLISMKIYSEIIRDCVTSAGVHLADVASYGMTYESIDGVHPTKAGMKTMADLWIKEIKKDIK